MDGKEVTGPYECRRCRLVTGKGASGDVDYLACGKEGVHSPSNQEREDLLIELRIREVVRLDQQR
jgi:hypothetical protein